tara:strand:- start:36 stop:683 length:648 start_codon:yes stop_codon:yes gene_type:complete
MTSIYNYDVYIFDCDGVVLNSNKLKSDAFREALKGEPAEKVDSLVNYHKANGGISRYKKFKHFYEVINPSNNIKQLCDAALIKFADIVSKGLLKVDYVPGVVSFFEKMYSSEKYLYINSGSDEKELRNVFEERGISHFFSNIYGSPDTKEKNLEKILKDLGREKRYLFFGDSNSDYSAAKAFNMDFAFISRYSEWENANGEFTFSAKDFRDFNQK